MKRWGLVLAALPLLGYAALAFPFPWNKDMVDQPAAKPQAAPAPPGPGSVPVTRGREIVPAPATEAEAFEAKDEAAALPNPVPATDESIARGGYLYELNCAVCHGAGGRGDGPVGRVFDPSPVDLTDAYTQDQADGQLFFTITRGRVAMPYYRDALTQQERWEIVHYLRDAFGGRR